MFLRNLKFVESSYILAGVFGLLLALSISAVPSLVWAQQGTVSSITINGVGLKLEEQVREVVILKVDKPYLQEDLDESIELIRDWGRFERYSAAAERREDGWHVRFDLLPGLIISSINFTGQFPYLTSQIRRNVGMRVGEVYEREEIIGEVKKVKRFFEREGYFATTINVDENVNDSAGVVGLTFHIHKGLRLRWRAIHVEGNTVFPNGFFSSKINAWFPYQPARLRKSLEKMREAYISKGYPRARVRVENLHRDFENKKADIWITVKENSHLTVNFIGNSRIRNRTLRKSVTFFRERSYDRYEVKQSELALRQLYLRRGFLAAEIKSERIQESDKEIAVNFYIDEGPQTLVKNIEFEGARDLNTGKLMSELSLKETSLFTAGYLSEPALQSDERRMPSLLMLAGFPDARLVDTDVTLNPWHDRADVTFKINEGVYAIIANLDFPGAVEADLPGLRRAVKLKIGSPYSKIAAQDNAEIIKNYYSDNGYPYAEVDPQAVIDPASGAVHLTFNIKKGKRVRIGEILIIGIDHSRPSTVRSAMSIKRGDDYSRARILKGESVMRRLGAFKSVDVKVLGLEDKLESVPILVQVEEQEQYAFDIKAAYSTDDKLSGQFIVTNFDVFGYGKRMNIKFDVGFDIRGVQWNFFDPHFVGSDFEMVLTALIVDEDRPSFQVTDIGGGVSFLREIGRSMSALGQVTVIRQIFRGGTPDPDDDTVDQTLPKVTFSFNYDTRDYFADPSRGMFGLASFSYFFPVVNTGANFVKLRGQYIYYWSPWRRLTAVNSLRLGGIVQVDGTAVPRPELFFIGGDYSIRGFQQDMAGPLGAGDVPIGQKVRMIWNSELQLRVLGEFKFAGFYDMASATDTFRITVPELRHSAGFGLRYITPVGPVRLDYGFILDRRAGEGIGRLHFTFGYAF